MIFHGIVKVDIYYVNCLKSKTQVEYFCTIRKELNVKRRINPSGTW